MLRLVAPRKKQIVRLNDRIRERLRPQPEARNDGPLNVPRVPILLGVFVRLFKFLADVLCQIARELVALPLFTCTAPAPTRPPEHSLHKATRRLRNLQHATGQMNRLAMKPTKPWIVEWDFTRTPFALRLGAGQVQYAIKVQEDKHLMPPRPSPLGYISQ